MSRIPILRVLSVALWLEDHSYIQAWQYLKRPGAQPVESANTSHPRHYTNYPYGGDCRKFAHIQGGGSTRFHCFILSCLEAREVRHHGEFDRWWSACLFLEKKKGVVSQRRTRFVMFLCSRVWDGENLPNFLYKFSEGKVRGSCLFTRIRGFFRPWGGEGRG